LGQPVRQASALVHVPPRKERKGRNISSLGITHLLFLKLAIKYCKTLPSVCDIGADVAGSYPETCDGVHTVYEQEERFDSEGHREYEETEPPP